MLNGIFPVLSTPFTAGGEVDPKGLNRLVLQCVIAGADGVVYPGIASEFATLQDDERRKMVDVVLETTAKLAIPAVIGISADEASKSGAYARQATQGGAAAVMIMAPRSSGDVAESITSFLAVALEDIGETPIILQNAPPPLGSSLPVPVVLGILKLDPRIRYVKEENMPCGHRMSALLKDAPPTLLGVMGGAGGRFVLDEYLRGACASMPSCELVEAHVQIWSLFRSGNIEAARKMLWRVLPLLNMGGVFRQSVVKHVLLRRSFIQSDHFRDSNPPLDETDRQELDAIVSSLRDLFLTTTETAHV